jgi:hypothetical protein
LTVVDYLCLLLVQTHFVNQLKQLTYLLNVLTALKTMAETVYSIQNQTICIFYEFVEFFTVLSVAFNVTSQNLYQILFELRIFNEVCFISNLLQGAFLQLLVKIDELVF